MKIAKRVTAILLAVVLCAVCIPASAAEPRGTTAALYRMYADGMLFQQGKPAVFAGTAVGGSHVECVLRDAAGEAAAKGAGSVSKSGRFSVGFIAPKGGYAEYTVELRLDGELFRTLHGVVFGELWLASGQSNMDMPLAQSETGEVMMAEGRKGSRWLRFYQAPTFVEYEGDVNRFPLEAQRDIPGGVWIDGTDDYVYSISAAAFFFAQKLQRELDMPVGVLQSSLGGSSIYSWLSREIIEADAPTLEYLQKQGWYFPAGDWKETGHSAFNDMTANYNKKIAPLRVFRPNGMIWYQGETDIFRSVPPAAYARAFDCMQRLYSSLFGYGEGERLPIVCTQIASFQYGGSVLQQFNDGLARMQTEQPRTRAVTSIYDVPLTYKTAIGYIHPTPKQPVGERMAYAAQGLVYGRNADTCSAPYPTHVEARDGSVYVTLSHTGRGLAVNGTRAAGFAVTDGSGIYVPAEAQIVSPDTVRIWSPGVALPTAASYAFAQVNATANLYATDDGGLALPVSPFITDPDGLRQAWQSRDWAECDDARVWRVVNEENTGFYDTWQAENASLGYAPSDDGGSVLTIVSDGAKEFAAMPSMRYESGRKLRPFPDADRDYSRYAAVTFRVRNTGEADVRLDAVCFETLRSWFAPAVCGTDDPDCVIPADGAWHEITLDMNVLYLRGNECGCTYSRRRLDDVRQIRLRFADPAGRGASVSVDAFRFTPDGTDGARVRFVPRFRAADNAWEWLCAVCMLLLRPFGK